MTHFNPIYPLRILSDLHFRDGHGPLRSPEQLEPLFAGAATVILNGDSIEELARPDWQCEADAASIEASAAKMGARLIKIAGNHDPSISDIQKVTISSLDLTIMHGDGWCRKRTHNKVDAGLPGATNISKRIMRYLSCIPHLHLWATFHLEHLRDARGTLVVGHSHRPGLWHSPLGRVINLGGHSPYPWARALQIDSPDAAHWRMAKIGYKGGLPFFKDTRMIPSEWRKDNRAYADAQKLSRNFATMRNLEHGGVSPGVAQPKQ